MTEKAARSTGIPGLVFLPVDERFCTRDYFLYLAEAAGISVKTPPVHYLGAKKIPPDMERLHSWLEKNVVSGDLLVISIDMLIHGGLIPSRMSLETLETLSKRLSILKRIKGMGCSVYASISVTRTPFYNSAEEEPDYWEYFGERIYDLSRLLAKRVMDGDMLSSIGTDSVDIPSWIVEDYVTRRERNFALVSQVLDLVADGTIDFLNLVLDDNSAESLSLAEARRHAARVDSLGIGDKVAIHAGADESTLTLLSKSLVDIYGSSPSFEVIYTSPAHRDFIPPYEGSPLHEGVKNHVEAAGGRIDEKGEIVLLVNNPDSAVESPDQPEIPESIAPYDEVSKAIESLKGRVLGIADVKYVNGADNYLVRLLLERFDIDWTRANFAAWNTAGNTLGTVCAYSIIEHLGAVGHLKLDEEKLKVLQAIFFLEHWGFQANVRQDLIREAKERGVLPWTVMPIEEWAAEYTAEKLMPYKEVLDKAMDVDRAGLRVWFPWHRSFEIGIGLGGADG